MDNTWIYILIILIFVIRGVVKSAVKQRDTATSASDQNEDRDIFGSEWKDIFPQTAPEVVLNKQPDKQPDKEYDKSGYKVEKEKNPPQHLTDKKTEISAPLEDVAEGLNYFEDDEDIRKGIIASEILKTKF